MSDAHEINPDLIHLENKLEELLANYTSLKQENLELQSKYSSVVQDSGRLREKNQLAVGKIEAMINRLKALEQASE
jgi:cell division protein ZapB